MIQLNYQPTKGDDMQLQSLLNMLSNLKHDRSVKGAIRDMVMNALKSSKAYLAENASEFIGMIITSIIVFFVTFVVLIMEFRHLEKTDVNNGTNSPFIHSKQ
jgi:predicted PurR-regulated permease PerM